MTAEEKRIYKEKSNNLCALIKNPECEISEVKLMLENGADVLFSAAKPIYLATKILRFDILDIFTRNGEFKNENAFRHITHICDVKGFNDEHEEQFFELLSRGIAILGEPLKAITPYVNSMAAIGKLDKIENARARYYLTGPEIASIIYDRIIFEAIGLGFESVALFVSSHREWITQNVLDAAVEAGDWFSLEYILNHSKFHTPSDKSVARAIFLNKFEVLDILLACGYSFNKKPIFLYQAFASVPSYGTDALEFLFNRGYSLEDKFNSKSLKENAIIAGNEKLIEFLKSYGEKKESNE